MPGHIGQIIKNKLNNVLRKNGKFDKLILNGELVPAFIMHSPLITKFKYAPATRVDVERSFSAYKNMFSETQLFNRTFRTAFNNQLFSGLVVFIFYKRFVWKCIFDENKIF